MTAKLAALADLVVVRNHLHALIQSDWKIKNYIPLSEEVTRMDERFIEEVTQLGAKGLCDQLSAPKARRKKPAR